MIAIAVRAGAAGIVAALVVLRRVPGNHPVALRKAKPRLAVQTGTPAAAKQATLDRAEAGQSGNMEADRMAAGELT